MNEERRATSVETSVETSEKTSEKILIKMRQNPEITIAELSNHIGVSGRSIERNLRKLQNNGYIRRIGPDKGGHWEVIE